MTQQPNLSQRLLDIAWRGVLDKFKANDNQPYEGMGEDLAGLRQMKVQEGKLPTGYSELPYGYQLLGTTRTIYEVVAPKSKTRLIIHVQVVNDDQNAEQDIIYRCEFLTAVEIKGQIGSLEQCRREGVALVLCPCCHRRICSQHFAENDPRDTKIAMCQNCNEDLSAEERKLVIALREQIEF